MSYRQLGPDEIRVIKLFTIRDGPEFATGPVCCKIEYVSLVGDRRSKGFKGSDRRWPPPVIEDIEVRPGRRDGADSNVLWPSLRSKRVEQSLPLRDLHQASDYSTNTEPKAHNLRSPELSSGDFDLQDPDAQLPWRFAWGDFIALSYVWGDPTEKREIIVDGTKFAATRNLEAALSQLRNHHRIQQGFRLWVDAICINQEDLVERAQQVPRMKYIYDSAWHIAIWLGPESDNSDMAIIAMRYFGLRSREDDPFEGVYRHIKRVQIKIPHVWRFEWTAVQRNLRKEVFRAIYHLLARPYFRRLWILQEVASGAKDTPVLCGARCIPLEDIHSTLQLIRNTTDGNLFGRDIIRSVVGQNGLERSWDQTPQGIDTHATSEKLWERPISIVGAQNDPLGSGDVASDNAIFKALVLSREAQTGDERDRIYGILGLPYLAEVIKMVPDYNLSPTTTFIEFSKSLFSSGNLNGLRLVASRVDSIYTKCFVRASGDFPAGAKFVRDPAVVNTGCEHLLPSWVICWSCPRNPAYNLPNRLLRGMQSLYIPPKFENNDKSMIIRGILLDTVGTLSAFHTTEEDSLYPFNGPQVTSIYGSESATKEALWRTITANTLHSGAPLPPGSHKILDRQNWKSISLAAGNQRRLFGLNNFYNRNKNLRLFDRTLKDWICLGGKKSMILSNPRDFAKKFKAYTAFPLYTQEERRMLRDVRLWAMQVLAWRRLITTEGGYLGIAPARTKAGDVIAVVPGCDLPLILRREGNGNGFRVLGESYLHGLSSKEIIVQIQNGTKEMIDITLV